LTTPAEKERDLRKERIQRREGGRGKEVSEVKDPFYRRD